MVDEAGAAAAGGAAAAPDDRPTTRRPPSASATTTATHDDAGERDEGDMGWWGEVAGAGGETFRQIPINALMDHNDDVRRVCDDFTRALKCVRGWAWPAVAAYVRMSGSITLADAQPLHSFIHSTNQPTGSTPRRRNV